MDAEPAHGALRRVLGVPGATLLGLGSILGTGIFVSIGLAAGLAGGHLVGAILLAAGLATCNALSSAQLAAAHSVSGGTYEYGYRILRPEAGFLAGWMFLCAKIASAATAAIGVSGYALALFGVNSPALLAAGAGLAALLVTGLVLGGLRRSAAVNAAIVSTTVAALVLLVAMSFRHAPTGAVADLARLSTGESGRGAGAFLGATALMFVAYTGYGRVATLGEEVAAPRRTIPRAIVATLWISGLLYVGVAAAGLIAVGADGLAAATSGKATPLEAVARAVGGPYLRLAIAIAAVTAMLGVLINLILGLSRVVLAMARRGDLPQRLARLSPGAQPAGAVLLTGGLVTLLAVAGTVEVAWTFSALTVLVYYAVTNLAALRMDRADRLYPQWVPALGLAGCLGLVMFIPFPIWLAGALLTATGFLLRAVLHRRRRMAS